MEKLPTRKDIRHLHETFSIVKSVIHQLRELISRIVLVQCTLGRLREDGMDLQDLEGLHAGLDETIRIIWMGNDGLRISKPPRAIFRAAQSSQEWAGG
jgi:hypothetical protein